VILCKQHYQQLAISHFPSSLLSLALMAAMEKAFASRLQNLVFLQGAYERRYISISTQASSHR
jgi:hypothetical protein